MLQNKQGIAQFKNRLKMLQRKIRIGLMMLQKEKGIVKVEQLNFWGGKTKKN